MFARIGFGSVSFAFGCKILLLLCFLSQLKADETYWDAHLVRSYVHHSEMQRRWATAFLAPHLQELNGDEQILDIGCGDGKITADISQFIPRGAILGIDPSEPMLNWAKKQYCALEYPHLSFQEGGFLEHNLSKIFDVIISNCALQHCADQEVAFKHLAQLLKSGGKLLVMIPAIDNAAWKQARKNVQSAEKWAAYWRSIAPRNFYTLEECAKLLKSADLKPIRIEKVHTKDPFVDRQELLDFLLGTFMPAVPPDLLEAFYNELIDEYLRLLPEALQENGVIEMRFGRIEIEATK